MPVWALGSFLPENSEEAFAAADLVSVPVWALGSFLLATANEADLGVEEVARFSARVGSGVFSTLSISDITFAFDESPVEFQCPCGLWGLFYWQL